MVQTLVLARWEWFKLRRRWMPWVLLIILVLFSQLFLWGSFFSYQAGPGVRMGVGDAGAASLMVDCRDLVAGRQDLPPGTPPEMAEQLRANCEQAIARHEALHRPAFTLPGSLLNALTVAQSIGLLLAAILAASAVGTEFGWGTLRSVLVRGTGRWPYLAAKLLLLAVVAAGALGVVLALAALSSLVAGALAAPLERAIDTAGAQWGHVAEAFGRMWLSLLPYIVLGSAIAVVTGSSAAGTGITLGYHFAEQIGAAILINLFDWGQTVTDYLLARNITAWVMGSPAEGPRGGLLFTVGLGEMPGEGHALLVILAYMVALGGLAFWRLARRDVTGLNGG